MNHPREIASCFTEKGSVIKTLSVEEWLEPAGFSEEENGQLTDPLKLFESYSVYRVTLIQKDKTTGDKFFCTANIPERELSKISRRTMIATDKIMESEYEVPAEDEEDAAYTVMIRVGKFKGMSPAAVLLNNPESVDDLKSTGNWLAGKSQSEGNKRQIEAIRCALRLQQEGKLIHRKTVEPIRIYQADYRPLHRRVREDGKGLIYALGIRCIPTNNMPFSIQIDNQWAEFSGKEPVQGTYSDKISIEMAISESDFDHIVDRMLLTRENFCKAYAVEQLRREREELKKVRGQ